MLIPTSVSRSAAATYPRYSRENFMKQLAITCSVLVLFGCAGKQTGAASDTASTSAAAATGAESGASVANVHLETRVANDAGQIAGTVKFTNDNGFNVKDPILHCTQHGSDDARIATFDHKIEKVLPAHQTTTIPYAQLGPMDAKATRVTCELGSVSSAP